MAKARKSLIEELLEGIKGEFFRLNCPNCKIIKIEGIDRNYG